MQRFKQMLLHGSAARNEWRKDTLLAGKPLRFSAAAPAKNRTIRAEWIEEAVRRSVNVEVENAIIEGSIDLKYEVVEKELAITESVILGTVDLSYSSVNRVLDFGNTTFCKPANFRNSVMKAPVSLSQAEFRDKLDFGDADMRGVLDCSATIFRTVTFNRAVMEKSVICEGATFKEEADFRYCSVAANARFYLATFEGSAHFVGAVIGQDASFNPAFFDEEANFRGWQVGGHAYFDYAWENLLIRAEDRRLLNSGAIFRGGSNFNSGRFAKGAYFDNAVFQGYTNFGSVKVVDQVSFTGGEFRGGAGFDEAEIDGKTLFHGARFEEYVSFARAKFGAGVYFQHALFHNAYFPGAMFKKTVNLIGASCGPALEFDGEPAVYHSNTKEVPESVKLAGLSERLAEIDLRGCTYDRIAVASWEDLVNHVEPFEPQPLVQLEKALRLAGKDEDANGVYFERRSREGKLKGGLRRIGDGILWALVGYGVRPFRLLSWIAVALVLGSYIFQLEGAVRPVEEGQGRGTASCEQSCQLTASESFWESLDTFLPLPGGLPAGRVWEPTADNVAVSVGNMKYNLPASYAAFASALRLAGWIIVPVGVAGVAGVLQRRSST